MIFVIITILAVIIRGVFIFLGNYFLLLLLLEKLHLEAYAPTAFFFKPSLDKTQTTGNRK